jgi:FAD:protein FMN transferase
MRLISARAGNLQETILYLKLGMTISLFFVLAGSTLWSQEVGSSAACLGEGSARFDFEFPAMGTLVQITAYGQKQQSLELVCQLAKQRVEELAAILTDYEPDSETRQLSQRAFNQPLRVSDPLWSVLDAADQWYELSAGALDCSIGQLTVMWRKHRRAGRLPTDQDVQKALSHTGWRNVKLDRQQRTITHNHEQLRFDFGAIGKGYIADEAFKVIQANDVRSCLVNIAGNMRCGDPPPGKPGWRIAISSPAGDNTRSESHSQTALIGTILICNQAIATSGDLHQYTVIDGVKRSHILDPLTGYGIAGPLAVTVVAPNAMDADALATIGCIMDWPSYCKLIASRQAVCALKASLLEQQLKIERSSDFPEISQPDADG